MICLKNRTFAVSQTTVGGVSLGEKSVVICLKNRTFAVSQTTRTYWVRLLRALWFAWKIVLLQYRKQQPMTGLFMTYSCDLLEKSYFCSIANNYVTQADLTRKVVICLKNRTFAVSQTTAWCISFRHQWLWFAWKIVLLQYRKQLRAWPTWRPRCCDLLEKSYFCSIANNVNRVNKVTRLVVICLKNRTFAVSQTTEYILCSAIKRLWFAWKIVLLQYRKQQMVIASATKLVVICLKNRTFAVSQTTRLAASVSWYALWFAWKIVLLQYRKQLLLMGFLYKVCCDLLEKSYFCSIANNL